MAIKRYQIKTTKIQVFSEKLTKSKCKIFAIILQSNCNNIMFVCT